MADIVDSLLKASELCPISGSMTLDRPNLLYSNVSFCFTGGVYTCFCVLYVIALVVTALVVGIIFGKRFESIPNSCATWKECRIHCDDKSVYLNATLLDIDLDHNCGKCNCSCHDPEGCYPGKYNYIMSNRVKTSLLRNSNPPQSSCCLFIYILGF